MNEERTKEDQATVDAGDLVFDDVDDLDLVVPDLAPPDHERKWLVSPRAVAITAVLVGAACLVALAVVASVGNDDALATIALALAILAFGVQLLVFTAESYTASQQMLRSEQLNTQTRSLLTEMQTSARATETMVRDQFSQLLRAFMDAAKTADAGKTFDPEAFERRLLANIRREASLREPESSTRTSSRVRALERTREQARRRAESFSAGPFPSEEEARPVIDDLSSLSAEARGRLKAFGRDQARARERPEITYEGLPTASAHGEKDQQLMDRDLIQLVRLSQDDVPSAIQMPDQGLVLRLTDKGELAARVLNSSGAIPDWAAPFFTGSD